MFRPAPLSALPLDARDQAFCRRAGYRDASQLLCAPTAELRKTFTNLVDAETVERIHRAAVVGQAPTLKSALEQLHDECAGISDESSSPPSSSCLTDRVAQQTTQTNCLTTGDEAIDVMLGGGFYRGALTEIVGQSAVGKTQLALQSAVFAALALGKDVEVRHAAQGVRPRDRRKDETTDIFDALHGQGIRPSSERKSVVIITFDGIGETQMILRRMQEMSDNFVEDRWERLRRSHSTYPEGESSSRRKRKGAFAATESDRFYLCDVQHLARAQLLGNIHIAAVKNYGMLQHTIEYDMDNLIGKVRQEGMPDVGLIIIDDITASIHEAAEQRVARPSEMVVERSRLCCELSDHLKVLAAQRLAVVVINHVVDLSDRHKELLRSIVEDELTAMADEEANVPSSSSLHIVHHRPTPKGHESNLHLAYQELYFAGTTAHIHQDNLRAVHANLGGPVLPAQLIDGFMADLRVASLSLSWVNSINARVVLTRTPHIVVLPLQRRKRLRQAGLRGTHTFGVRRASSILSPFAHASNEKQACVNYIISVDGLRSLRSLEIEEHIAEKADEEKMWDSAADGDLLHDDEITWLTQIEQANHLDHTPSSSSILVS